MNRVGRVIGPILGLALTCSITSCSTPPRKFLQLTNDTPTTVTVKECTTAQECASTPKHVLRPGESDDFRYSSRSSQSLLVINGYGGSPRCFMVPTGYRKTVARVKVTQVLAGNCPGLL